MRECKVRIVYDCFNNIFLDDFCIPDSNLPPITIDDSPCLKKSRYTSDPLPDSIPVASEKSFIILNAI